MSSLSPLTQNSPSTSTRETYQSKWNPPHITFSSNAPLKEKSCLANIVHPFRGNCHRRNQADHFLCLLSTAGPWGDSCCFMTIHTIVQMDEGQVCREEAVN